MMPSGTVASSLDIQSIIDPIDDDLHLSRNAVFFRSLNVAREKNRAHGSKRKS
jgi:hypothetical protein